MLLENLSGVLSLYRFTLPAKRSFSLSKHVGNLLSIKSASAQSFSQFIDSCHELSVLLERVFDLAIPAATSLVLPESPAEQLIGEERQLLWIIRRKQQRRSSRSNAFQLGGDV